MKNRQRRLAMGLVGVLLSPGLAAAEEPKQVRVRLESDNPKVELIQVAGDGLGVATSNQLTLVLRRSICRPPCNEVVAADYRSKYVIGGDGVLPAGPFDFEPYKSGESVAVRVKAGDVGGAVLGATLGTLGVIAAIAGGAGALVGAGQEPKSSAETMSWAVPLSLGGLGGLILGIVVGNHSRTTYDLRRDDKPQEPAPRPGQTTI